MNNQESKETIYQNKIAIAAINIASFLSLIIFVLDTNKDITIPRLILIYIVYLFLLFPVIFYTIYLFLLPLRYKSKNKYVFGSVNRTLTITDETIDYFFDTAASIAPEIFLKALWATLVFRFVDFITRNKSLFLFSIIYILIYFILGNIIGKVIELLLKAKPTNEYYLGSGFIYILKKMFINIKRHKNKK